MLLLYAADMHGSEQVWRKFVNAASFYHADVLVLGGDVTGKRMIPVVEQKPGHYRAVLFDKTEKAKAGPELDSLEKRLRFNGFYPWRCTPEEHLRAAEDAEYCQRAMVDLMVATASRWAQIADEKLRGGSVRIYGMPGNDDHAAIDDVFRGDYLVNVEGRVVRIGDYQLLSCAWSNPTPWNTPRELPEDRLLEKLEALAALLEPDVPTIFNLHIPPFNSGLDIAFEVKGVDEEGVVILRKVGGNPVEVPVGSTAVRTLIEHHAPLLSLHSHIHESRRVCHIGRTLCVNPGSVYQDGVLSGALLELEGDEVVKYQLVSG